jgi:phosphotransferase system enzyme I (PtsI)
VSQSSRITGEWGEIRKRGTAASPGIAIGRAYVVDRRKLKTPKRHLKREEVDGEVARFRAALEASDVELERIKLKIEEREESEHYNLIAAHQLILHDEHLVDETLRYIRDKRINAEWALRKTVEHIKGVFDSIEDDYFRERRSDVDFVGERVISNLMGNPTELVRPPPDAIVVAHDLSPADTIQLTRAAVAGIITDAGGKTSHTAILARAHQLPAVVGLEDVTSVVGNDDLVIVDGSLGLVILNPMPQSVAHFRGRARQEAAIGEALLGNRDLPAQTLDGVGVTLMANIDFAEEIVSALDCGAEGIGLFRTEFLFMMGEEPPGEEEHYRNACAVLESLHGRIATIRTFDLGADKLGRLLPDHYREANPGLGLRSIRLSMSDAIYPLFKAQLRGLLRASSYGALRIMFPMISGIGELRGALAALEEAKNELRDEGVAFNEKVPIGIMIETPSAAIMADKIAAEVDFLSIGTNDLIQYTLAVDRVNELVAYLYEALHPSILRLIKMVTEAGAARGVPVSLCGEMAADANVAPLLLGLGLRELSMNAVAIPAVKAALRGVRFDEAAAAVADILTLPSATEVRHRVREHFGHLTPRPDIPASPDDSLIED